MSTAIQTEPLTHEMLTALRDEAAAVGDDAQVRMCRGAIAGDIRDRRACALVISAARGMDDSRPFVRVVADHRTMGGSR